MTRLRLREVTAMPLLTSAAVVSTIRLVRRRLTVSGSTESRVLSRNVPPSMISVSLRGPSLLKLSSLRITSSFRGSI
ncbi:Uncharacterised protein [Mycobacteroides abscessus subsp. abscessus]|nr:Uncharacterised protein [Mycobacteroides abscessus subsp. abscessus]SIN44584.1 Uncharacterised protein [Mycobacteroides abscessus subsp. abscessus]SKW13531.1 Uncharacterised protein [Mycobacteroides abscessus subsp. abscessus]